MSIEEKTTELLRIEDAIRQALERAARRLEEQQGNSTYMQAWAKGARLIRAMKP